MLLLLSDVEGGKFIHLMITWSAREGGTRSEGQGVKRVKQAANAVRRSIENTHLNWRGVCWLWLWVGFSFFLKKKNIHAFKGHWSHLNHLQGRCWKTGKPISTIKPTVLYFKQECLETLNFINLIIHVLHLWNQQFLNESRFSFNRD